MAERRYSDDYSIKFRENVTVISMEREYPNHLGKEKFMVITEMTEKELLEIYPEDMKKVSPYVICPPEMKMILKEYHAAEMKHRYRAERAEEKLIEMKANGKEIREPQVLPEYERAQEEEKEERWKECVMKVWKKELGKLSEQQLARLAKYHLLGMNFDQIAEEEENCTASVFECIKRAEDNLRKDFLNKVRREFEAGEKY